MDSGQAHGWLFVGLINEHLMEQWSGDAYGAIPEGVTFYCPECCGPCGALRDYFNTPRGRAEAQTYLSAMGREGRNWSWAPGGIIDWVQIEQWMELGFCPNHKEN